MALLKLHTQVKLSLMAFRLRKRCLLSSLKVSQGRALMPASPLRSYWLSLRQFSTRTSASGDYWQHDEEKGEITPVHKAPRTALFVPTASVHSPVPLSSVGPERVTSAQYVDGERVTKLDEWQGTGRSSEFLSADHKRMWIGKSVFRVLTRGGARSVAPLPPASKFNRNESPTRLETRKWSSHSGPSFNRNESPTRLETSNWSSRFNRSESPSSIAPLPPALKKVAPVLPTPEDVECCCADRDCLLCKAKFVGGMRSSPDGCDGLGAVALGGCLAFPRDLGLSGDEATASPWVSPPDPSATCSIPVSLGIDQGSLGGVPSPCVKSWKA